MFSDCSPLLSCVLFVFTGYSGYSVDNIRVDRQVGHGTTLRLQNHTSAVNGSAGWRDRTEPAGEARGEATPEERAVLCRYGRARERRTQRRRTKRKTLTWWRRLFEVFMFRRPSTAAAPPTRQSSAAPAPSTGAPRAQTCEKTIWKLTTTWTARNHSGQHGKKSPELSSIEVNIFDEHDSRFQCIDSYLMSTSTLRFVF